MKKCKCGNILKSFYGKQCQKCYFKSRRGIKLSEGTKKKISDSKLAEKNPMWRGDSVGYVQLHVWVKKRKKKPAFCECCKKVSPLDLANKGEYSRDLKNWEWLCRRCHMKKDGRIKNLLRGMAKNVTRNKKGRFQLL